MNILIFLLTLVVSIICFLAAYKKGSVAVLASMMVRGLRVELIVPTLLLGSGLYFLFLAVKYIPFFIVWK